MVETRMEKLSIRSKKSGNINCLFHVFRLEASINPWQNAMSFKAGTSCLLE